MPGIKCVKVPKQGLIPRKSQTHNRPFTHRTQNPTSASEDLKTPGVQGAQPHGALSFGLSSEKAQARAAAPPVGSSLLPPTPPGGVPGPLRQRAAFAPQVEKRRTGHPARTKKGLPQNVPTFYRSPIILRMVRGWGPLLFSPARRPAALALSHQREGSPPPHRPG